jgi:hypothetical protein
MRNVVGDVDHRQRRQRAGDRIRDFDRSHKSALNRESAR